MIKCVNGKKKTLNLHCSVFLSLNFFIDNFKLTHLNKASGNSLLNLQRNVTKQGMCWLSLQNNPDIIIIHKKTLLPLRCLIDKNIYQPLFLPFAFVLGWKRNLSSRLETASLWLINYTRGSTWIVNFQVDYTYIIKAPVLQQVKVTKEGKMYCQNRLGKNEVSPTEEDCCLVF